MAITQVTGLQPKKQISIEGITYELRKNATDPSATFNHQRVSWINTGCEPLKSNPNIYFCWIMGVIPPNPGSLEKTTNVLYIGFHNQRISMTPTSLKHDDIERMHIYVSEYSDYIGKFVDKFLGNDLEREDRETISPWPHAEVAE